MSTTDKGILDHISELVDEEHRLLTERGDPQAKHARLKHVSEQLDQCWDLLRQRRAKREFGEDPDSAQVRDPRTVESYRG
ncbi:MULTISPECIES: DUF2630 family protein [Ramlibacter]|uniref:DUF2630 family protein n=1 Tax=Ramlibacter pinisoli TaxID=2682844 RepID=A0A6N8J1E0_9BURK|nr:MULTISPECIES: DUF2630 family protein [Ramlibacter]MBA2962713.1 DUF2630 family protein [Ramlibacter sp. CGMCC 1.13660]MVQ32655.1 DUF2630 family protein [Ramlibacter pinisoli]